MKSIDYWLYRSKYLFGRSLQLTAPVDISMELSSLCNMRCTYCYHADKKNLPFKMGFMPLETAKLIIDQAAELGVNSIKMNWRGEGTMNPHYSEICHYAKSKSNRRVFIDRLSNSNFLFDTAKDHIFSGLACQTKVKVSYDSFRKDVFETQRAGGNHDITTANIDKFYNWPGRQTELMIQVVRTQRNKDEDFEGETKKRWPSIGLSIRDVVSGRLKKDISEIEVKKRDLTKQKHENRQSCIQAHVRLIFDSFGRASPCCPDIKNELVLGNIHETHMFNIFNSEKARLLRESLKNKSAFDLDPCKNCSSHESFKGYKPSWVS